MQGDISLKMNEIATDLKDTMGRVEEAEQRVAHLDEWTTEAGELLRETLDIQ